MKRCREGSVLHLEKQEEVLSVGVERELAVKPARQPHCLAQIGGLRDAYTANPSQSCDRNLCQVVECAINLVIYMRAGSAKQKKNSQPARCFTPIKNDERVANHFRLKHGPAEPLCAPSLVHLENLLFGCVSLSPS